VGSQDRIRFTDPEIFPFFRRHQPVQSPYKESAIDECLLNCVDTHDVRSFPAHPEFPVAMKHLYKGRTNLISIDYYAKSADLFFWGMTGVHSKDEKIEECP
jgi:hypothetical protein